MKTERNRESGLELLRIIAIILIVSHHLVVHCPFDLWAEPFCLKRLFSSFFTGRQERLESLYSFLSPFGSLPIRKYRFDRLRKKFGRCEHPVFLESEFFGVAVYY